jgi:hypothetical protein
MQVREREARGHCNIEAHIPTSEVNISWYDK